MAHLLEESDVEAMSDFARKKIAYYVDGPFHVVRIVQHRYRAQPLARYGNDVAGMKCEFGGPCGIRAHDLRIKRHIVRPSDRYVHFRQSSGKTQA